MRRTKTKNNKYDQPADERMGRFTNRAPLVRTDRASGPIWCRHCGTKVRSRLGDVCSHPECQRLALAAAEPRGRGRR